MIVRTPHAVVVEGDFASVRAPTLSGQVGLRAGAEPAVLVLEAGVLLLRRGAALRFVATAGGVLRSERAAIEVFTPLAIVGADAASVRTKLDQALAVPSEERELRRELQRLETDILRELRGRERSVPSRRRVG